MKWSHTRETWRTSVSFSPNLYSLVLLQQLQSLRDSCSPSCHWSPISLALTVLVRFPGKERLASAVATGIWCVMIITTRVKEGLKPGEKKVNSRRPMLLSASYAVFPGGIFRFGSDYRSNDYRFSYRASDETERIPGFAFSTVVGLLIS